MDDIDARQVLLSQCETYIRALADELVHIDHKYEPLAHQAFLLADRVHAALVAKRGGE